MEPQTGIQLKEHTTFHIGGPADYFIVATTVDELRTGVIFAREKNLPVIPLGGGSNMLVDDRGIHAVVIKVAILGITYEAVGTYEAYARVGAGVIFDTFVADSVVHGYWGLENLSAIPGTVGATPIQNVGAYGVDMATVVHEVRALDMRTGEEKIFAVSDCMFGYRASFFKTPEGKHYIVTGVTYKVTKIPTPRIHYNDLVRTFGDSVPTLHEVREAIIAIRSKKFPDWHTFGTAGSFFKNPFISAEAFVALKIKYPEMPGYVNDDGSIKVPLGWILDKVLHIRGVREGNVGSYEGQSLVLVNYSNATAVEVDDFAKSIEEKVYDATGIRIAREVVMCK